MRVVVINVGDAGAAFRYGRRASFVLLVMLLLSFNRSRHDIDLDLADNGGAYTSTSSSLIILIEHSFVSENPVRAWLSLSHLLKRRSDTSEAVEGRRSKRMKVGYCSDVAKSRSATAAAAASTLCVWCLRQKR